jgi:hypothetical protein
MAAVAAAPWRCVRDAATFRGTPGFDRDKSHHGFLFEKLIAHIHGRGVDPEAGMFLASS